MTRTLRPLELPDTAPEVAKARAAEFALGVRDVALVFGVSKQAAYDWAREGRVAPSGLRTAIPSLRAPADHKQEPLRFRVADIDQFAADQGLAVDYGKLALELQRRLGVGAYGPQHGPFTRGEVVDELISEASAARQLNMSRQSLQKRRTSGRLNPALHLDGSSYSQLDIIRVIDGELELTLVAEPE